MEHEYLTINFIHSKNRESMIRNFYLSFFLCLLLLNACKKDEQKSPTSKVISMDYDTSSNNTGPTTFFDYDNQGRIIAYLTKNEQSQSLERIISVTFEKNKITVTRFPDSSSPTHSFSKLDNQGRIIESEVPGRGFSVFFNYNNDGYLSKFYYKNGIENYTTITWDGPRIKKLFSAAVGHESDGKNATVTYLNEQSDNIPLNAMLMNSVLLGQQITNEGFISEFLGKKPAYLMERIDISYVNGYRDEYISFKYEKDEKGRISKLTRFHSGSNFTYVFTFHYE